MSIQNPGAEKLHEVKRRGPIRCIAFLHVFTVVLSFIPQTWHGQLDYVSIQVKKKNIEAKAFSDV